MDRRRQGKVERDRRLNSSGIQFKSLAHEGKEFIPRGELEIAQQCVDVLEEFLSSA